MIFITAGMGGGSEWAAFDFFRGATAWADWPSEPGKSFGGSGPGMRYDLGHSRDWGGRKVSDPVCALCF
jgi:hypothetical protein